MDETGDLRNASATHEAIPEKEILHSCGPVQWGGVAVVDVEVDEKGDVIVQILANTW